MHSLYFTHMPFYNSPYDDKPEYFIPLYQKPDKPYPALMPKRVEKEEQEPILIAVGKQIRSIREGQNISQEKFALKAGIDRTYYSGIELGYRNLATKNLVKIARHLGVEVGDLFPPMTELLAELDTDSL
jgi:DNA-binding XRE family transcriptional regulator